MTKICFNNDRIVHSSNAYSLANIIETKNVDHILLQHKLMHSISLNKIIQNQNQIETTIITIKKDFDKFFKDNANTNNAILLSIFDKNDFNKYKCNIVKVIYVSDIIEQLLQKINFKNKMNLTYTMKNELCVNFLFNPHLIKNKFFHEKSSPSTIIDDLKKWIKNIIKKYIYLEENLTKINQSLDFLYNAKVAYSRKNTPVVITTSGFSKFKPLVQHIDIEKFDKLFVDPDTIQLTKKISDQIAVFQRNANIIMRKTKKSKFAFIHTKEISFSILNIENRKIEGSDIIGCKFSISGINYPLTIESLKFCISYLKLINKLDSFLIQLERYLLLTI